MTKVSECRSCKEPIVWVTTRKGKKMPLDPDPVPNGPFIYDGDPEEARVVYIGEKDRYTGDRYASHFSTCPNVGEHRR